MSIKVGICGVGSFANSFIPLFKAHPLVERVILCDLDEEKLREKSERFEIPDTCPSLDELCDSDVDAIAVITQNWMHGPQAVQALRSGKHVYSAVPSAITMDEITELVRAVEDTGLIYMIGETSYYYPAAIYCRERLQRADFGRIVYGEGEYYHDWDHGLYDVMKWRGGKDWMKTAGAPPMHYPTHSVAMIVSVTGAYATHVSGFGFTDEHEDGIYNPEVNIWHNSFSNESALFKMSDDSMMRINEFRRIGHPGAVGLSLYGTEGSYEEQANARAWVTKERSEMTDLSELLAPAGVPAEPDDEMAAVTTAGTHEGVSRVHDVARLPKEFIGLPNGHRGSHQFLVDDFVGACVRNEQTPNNVWQAARYLIPGLIAHESALRGGELMEVPDLGDGPDVE